MAVSERTHSPIVDTAHSPFARLRSVPVSAVRLEDTFWAPRLERNRAVTLPQQYAQCEETGRLDNFRRAAGSGEGAFQGRYFNDSDVYKWLEAAAWELASAGDPELERQVDETIELVAAAQRPDGYLNTYFTFERSDERWTDWDLHEMYCAGHLFQAAVAHHRATGSERLLGVATRFADHLIDQFGPESEGKRVATDGHPEVELALVELYRETGDRRYLDQAMFFLDARGRGVLGGAFGRFGAAYHQDHQPFRELDEIVGHAVRALYLNAGAADLYLETGDAALRGALDRLWDNFTGRKLYVTGGAGARHEGEAFGDDYELPNARAYTETCAAIASVMWNWRLLLAEGDARYADLIELTLYNGVLSGLALDGATYFYVNPLEDAGHHRRQPWFGTACCPPNVARTLPSLPGHVYTVDDDGLWVHLYVANRAELTLPGGAELRLSQRTDYPWDGEIELEITEVRTAGELALRLRIPAWCAAGASLEVNGQAVETPLTPGAYAEVRRVWATGDLVRLRLPMEVRRLETHPRVAENAGRVALARGPLVYCAEAADNPGFDPRDATLAPGGATSIERRPDLLGGVVTLRAEVDVAAPDAGWNGRLYRLTTEAPPPVRERRELTLIPYYAWANREPGPMLVWPRSGE